MASYMVLCLFKIMEKEREEAYKKFFKDDKNFSSQCVRIKDGYIHSKYEAYSKIDLYLRKGIEP